MSYDLMVFEKNKAPRERETFMEWYENQTEWSEDHSYEDPAVSSLALQEFFMKMKEVFPPMNGAYSPSDQELLEKPELENLLTDYCIGRDVIYMAFAWSEADHAYDVVKRTAAACKVGFFDASGDGSLVFPDDE